MSVNKKTHAEIVAEMRNRAKRPDFVSQDVLKSCADELDAAHRREIDEIVALATRYRTALARINALATYCCQPDTRAQIIEQCENIFAEERDGETKGTGVKK